MKLWWNKLSSYKTLGWDVDDTLIGQDWSWDLLDFIKANPYQQAHFIITFRSHGMQNFIPDHIAEYGHDMRMFHSVHNVPDLVYMNRGPEYRHWKGMMCQSLGIELLIDDDTNAVAQGCLHHGVSLMHPEDLVA